MTYPLYRGSAAAATELLKPGAQLNIPNIGLYFSRFYGGFSQEEQWKVPNESKKSFIDDTAKTNQPGHSAYAKALSLRQQQLCERLGGVCAVLETTGPFVTGTGISHPVENGFTFHPTLGLPYLPASGVKGMLRAWVEVWMEHASDEERRTRIEQWFGDSATNTQNDGHAGELIFFDALPTASVQMGCDIMTPHMVGWYEKGDVIAESNFASVAPADWHSPVPVPFLVVRAKTSFLWCIAPRLTGQAQTDAARQKAAQQALAALKEALEWAGAGAKTAVGYGRMVDAQAEQEQKKEENLKSSGIALGQEAWSDAKATWDKGKQELVVTHNGRKTAPLRQQAAQEMRAQLKPEDITKLDKGKAVTVQAQVAIQGNSVTLLRLNSL